MNATRMAVILPRLRLFPVVLCMETIKEAYINIQNAIQECLEVIKEFKKSPPKETINPEMVRRISFVTPREYVKT